MPSTICVAIPVKDGEAFLGRAIASVLAQEGVDLRVRVIDNLSSDGSVAVAERFAAQDPRVSVAVNPVDVAYYGSLNRALAETDAGLFVPFAADDVMLEGNLARKLEVLERTGAGFVHSATLVIDEHDRPLRLLHDHSETPPLLEAPAFFGVVAARNMVVAQSALAHTHLLREIGGFDARSFYCGDWLTWQRMGLRHRVATIREPLVAYRIHPESGHKDSHRKGLNGRDAPATLDRVFLDAEMPADWAEWRDPLVAISFRDNALAVHHEGVRRVAQGFAGYMLMGRGLARQPHDALLHQRYRELVTGAGLTVPAGVPFEAVVPRIAAADVAELGRTVREIGPLLGRLVIATAPERAEETLAVLEPALGDLELDAVILPTADPHELLTPGRVVIARWGSSDVDAAEAAGLPVWPYAIPDPFAARPDPERWETVHPAGCLP